jgi:hypothetical protein
MRVEHIGSATLYLGDAFEIVPTLQANTIGLIVWGAGLFTSYAPADDPEEARMADLFSYAAD